MVLSHNYNFQLFDKFTLNKTFFCFRNTYHVHTSNYQITTCLSKAVQRSFTLLYVLKVSATAMIRKILKIRVRIQQVLFKSRRVFGQRELERFGNFGTENQNVHSVKGSAVYSHERKPLTLCHVLPIPSYLLQLLCFD